MIAVGAPGQVGLARADGQLGGQIVGAWSQVVRRHPLVEAFVTCRHAQTSGTSSGLAQELKTQLERRERTVFVVHEDLGVATV